MGVCGGGRLCVCVWERGGERESVCVWERGGGGRERVGGAVCVCVGERGRERERERERLRCVSRAHLGVGVMGRGKTKSIAVSDVESGSPLRSLGTSRGHQHRVHINVNNVIDVQAYQCKAKFSREWGQEWCF